MKKFLLAIIFNFCIFNLMANDFVPKKSLQNYYFILITPIALSNDQMQYNCVAFLLDDLKVCRFPGGPLWSNSISAKESYLISQEQYLSLKSIAHKMDFLCLDYSSFKLQCQNPCAQSICGFALPWDPAMAYVFDDLQSIDQVVGCLVEKQQLLNLKLNLCTKHLAQDDCNSDFIITELDDLELLIDDINEDHYESKQLSNTAQVITNFFGKIFITGLMAYHDLKQKLIKILGVYYARSKT